MYTVYAFVYHEKCIKADYQYSPLEKVLSMGFFLMYFI